MIIKNAIDFLASRCDGAATEDGQGFNKFDAPLGHSLAGIPFQQWTSRQHRAAWQLLRKYKGQLAQGGIEYDKLPEPPQPGLSENTSESESEPEELKLLLVSQNKDHLILVAPYDADLVAHLRDVPHRYWDKEGKYGYPKANVIPLEEKSVLPLLEIAIKFNIEIGEDVVEILDALAEEMEQKLKIITASHAQDAEVEVLGLGGELRPFQKAGVAYASQAQRTFIADEMGLGKTIEALATLQATEAFPALIISPASLKLNWEREAKKWLPNRTTSVFRENDGETDILIINYDILKKLFGDDGKPLYKFKAIILDESHYCKNRKAQRTEYAEVLAMDTDIRLLLTGTPVLNRPEELISQLRILDRLDDLGGFWEFAHRYCNAHKKQIGKKEFWDFSGASNLDELNEKLRATCYIRRKKEDVLSELPAKQRSIISLEIDNRPEYDHAQAELIAWLKEKAMKDEGFQATITNLSPAEQLLAIDAHAEDKASKAERAEHLVKIEALKQLAVQGKLKEIEAWVTDFLESGEKLVLFAHHQNIIDQLAKKFNAPTITGQTPVEARQAAVDNFQTNPETNLIILNIKAGGVGLTLTAASNVAFVELDWTPAAHDQAEDRCHRIGQQNSVNCWYLLASKTIDEDIYALIEEKRRVVDAATEGGDLEEINVLKELLNKLMGNKEEKTEMTPQTTQKQIILVSCVGKKQQKPNTAAELYTSTWFKLARAYAEQSGHEWFVLSAEYFLVPPDQIIHPYDTTLKRKRYSARQGWAKRVFNEIKNKTKPGAKITILAGLPYREFLTDLLIEAGYTVEIPMDGLGIGQQLAWLKSKLGQIEPEPAPAELPNFDVFLEYPTTDQGLSLIPLQLIDQNPYQPRLNLNPVETQQLARSIRIQQKTLPDTMGLLQVPVARPASDGRVQLAFGHRRLSAFKYNNKFHGDEWDTWAAMPIKLVQMNDEEMYKTATIENDQRVNLNAIERATAIKKGIDTFGWTYEQAGKVHGLKKGSVKNLTDLLKLPPHVQELIATGQLAQQSGRHLVRLMKEDPPLEQQCIEKARHIAFNGLTTAKADEEVNRVLKENYDLKQLKAEVATLPCLRCHQKALFTKGPFRVSLITCEACNAKYHGVGDYEDCKAEIESEETRARHRETRYCRKCNNSRLFTGGEMHKEISITCGECNKQAKPNLWLTEPKQPELKPQPIELDCPECNSQKTVVEHPTTDLLHCLNCNESWGSLDYYNHKVKAKNTRIRYCPACNKIATIDARHPISKCKRCNVESATANWLGEEQQPEPEPQPKTPPEYCKKCGTELKKENAPFNCPKCNFEMVTQPLKCCNCDGTVNKQPRGGLKCSECQKEWSNLRRFREEEIANATNVETTEEINGTSDQPVEVEAEAKKTTIQKIWDTNNRKLAYEIVPDPWLPEPCSECHQIPLELEPAQEAFLEQILKMNDSGLTTLARLINLIRGGQLKDLQRLQEVTLNDQKFWRLINAK